MNKSENTEAKLRREIKRLNARIESLEKSNKEDLLSGLSDIELIEDQLHFGSLFRTLFDTIVHGVIYQAASGQIVAANGPVEKMLGLSQHQLTSRTSLDLRWKAIHEDGSDFPGETHPAMVALKTGKEVRNIVMGVFNPAIQQYAWFKIQSKPLFKPGKKNPHAVITTLDDITEVKRAEEALKEQIKGTGQLLDTMMDGYILADTDGKILDVNPAYCKMVLYSKAMLVKMNIGDLEVNLSATEIDQRIEQMVRVGGASFETRHRRKDGRMIDLEVSISILQHNKPPLVAAFVRNITEKKTAQNALDESRRQLTTLMSNLPGMAYRCLNDMNWTMTFVSEGATALTGYLPRQLINNKEVAYGSLIHPDDRKKVWSTIQSAIGREKNFQLSYRLNTAGGNEKWAWEQGQGVFNENGKLVALEGFVTDITGRMLADQALKNSEFLLRESQKVSDVGSYNLNIETGFWESSQTLLKIFGIDEDYKKDVAGWLNLIHPDDVNILNEYFSQAVLATHKPFNKEYRILRQTDQKERWVHGMGKLNFDGEGNPIRLIGTIQDITERKLVEEALLKSESMYRSLFENSNDAIYLMSNKKFELVNNRFVQMFGRPIHQILKPGFDELDLVAPKSKQFFRDRLKKLDDGDTPESKYEYTAISSDGKEFEVEASVTHIHYKHEKITQGIIRDITARKKQQEILMNTVLKVQEDEKYKFGNELHDGLGQLLISASMYLESIKKAADCLPTAKQDDLEKAVNLYKQAIRDARRISHGLMITGIDEHGLLYLVRQLCYNMSNPDTSFSFDHNSITEEMISNKIKIHLYRIVQELSSNIIRHSGATVAKISLTMPQSQVLSLVVSDNGKGFDKAQAGYGAGLQNIRHRITLLKGTYTLDTAQGKGTIFKIKFPV